MNRVVQHASLIVLLIGIISCQNKDRTDFKSGEWGGYWFQGKAEISSFDLIQMRYGEERFGEAILIYVTEDFSRSSQVKLDNPKESGNDKISVLKLNKTQSFLTGIYPYHTMSSAFTPIFEDSPGLKFSASIQEWCGQTYMQVNKRSRAKYSGNLFSYFEQEGDTDFSFTGMLEDDLWNLLRINPKYIPQGNVDLLPSLIYLRFNHLPITTVEANIKTVSNGPQLEKLVINYPLLKRSLEIEYETSFPFEILGWKEIVITKDGITEISTAKRKGFSVVDYWNRNTNADEFLRKELNLN
jgi:hypothetical protein